MRERVCVTAGSTLERQTTTARVAGATEVAGTFMARLLARPPHDRRFSGRQAISTNKRVCAQVQARFYAMTIKSINLLR
jgi:hypothetical protein